MKRITALPLRMLRRLPWDNRGAIAMISGLVLVPVLLFTALVVDVGRMYYVRRDLQNIADATCLACAYGLSESQSKAQTNANEALVKNNFDPNGATIELSVPAGDADYDTKYGNPRVRVTLIENTALFFARIINHFSKDVSAKAVCELGNYKGGVGILPFGVMVMDGTSCHCDASGCHVDNPAGSPNDDWLFGYPLGQVVRLKYSPSNKTQFPGNFNAIDIGGPGANIYRDNIINGSTVPVSMCDEIQTETGNMAGPTRDGILDRLGTDTHNLHNIWACPPSQIDCNPPYTTNLASWIDGQLPSVPDCPATALDVCCMAPEGYVTCRQWPTVDCLAPPPVGAPCAPWDTFAQFPLAKAVDIHLSLWDCPRVGIVPFVTPSTEKLQGKFYTHILGFGAFVILGSGKQGNDAWVDGVFFRAVNNPNDYTEWGPWLGSETSLPTVTLVK